MKELLFESEKEFIDERDLIHREDGEIDMTRPGVDKTEEDEEAALVRDEGNNPDEEDEEDN